VSLPHRQKQSFYQSLAQLLRSGIPFPSALDKLAVTAHGRLRRLMKGLAASVDAGKTVGDAFAGQRAEISPMESGVISAVEQSGKLEHGFQQLGLHFGALAQAREMIIQKSLYPGFMLHFGILSLALPVLFSDGAGPYLRATAPTLGIVYLAIAVLLVLLPLLRDAGTTSPLIDRFLRGLPLFGKMRSHFANARFCMIYQLELDAGVNVLDALGAAGHASQSGLIRAVVDTALPAMRNGSQVGPLLARSRVFPENMMRSLIVGEESGGLDAALRELAANFQSDGLQALESGARRLGKLIYLGVVLYVGWRIIHSYQGMIDQQKALIDGF
jgi:type II secretory pathway component PulF